MSVSYTIFWILMIAVEKCSVAPEKDHAKTRGECQIDKNSFKCICPSPFSGDTCEKEDEQTDPCERNPCQNGGTCQLDDDNKNHTCDCLKGVRGNNCEIINWCENNTKICGRALCKYDKNIESGFCFCDEGFYFNAKEGKCEELDKCLFQRINGNCSRKHETCDSKGICKCEDNYAYIEGNSACERFRQFGQKCVKVDKCAPGVSQCQQKCTKGQCLCFAGFTLKADNYTCERKETTSECNLECDHLGTCVNEGNTPKCNCPQISHVSRNNTCIDKCAAGLISEEECPSEVGCLSDEGHGYTCNCTGKYGFADDNIHCRAKQMCSEGDGNEICSKKNELCEDDFASPEGYKCKCKLGYEREESTGVCRHKCEIASCDKKQALCIITDQNKAECICPPLLVKSSEGKCNQLAKYSYLGDFAVPKEKYQLIRNKNSGRMKRDISKDINYSKLLNDFGTSMKKIFESYVDASILRCTDKDDDLSCSLEIKLKEDPKEKINIVSTPSVCLSMDESHCLIQPDFVIRKRSEEVFHKTDPCSEIVNEKMCGKETQCKVSSPRGFKCECRQGYFRRNYYVPAPDVVIEVCEGDYTCKCIDGYHLEKGKSVKVDGCKAVCDPNPCDHGKCSVTGKDGFLCSCDDLYTGRFCNQTNGAIKDIKQAGTKTSAIVGGVLGAFLVMAIIICIILFRKIQKQKSIDETEEYVRQRKRGLVSEMRKLGRRQPENDDVELRDNERRPNRENEDQGYNSQYRINPIDSMSIPRPQLGRSADKGSNDRDDMSERRESGDYRRGYNGDDRILPKAHSSRHTNEEARRSSQRDDDRQERSRRPPSRSSDPLDNEKRGVSRMQYRNRGYEED
ncbi:Matrilin-2 like protein [Argiope bruennichi]|uniref:Matrilin-2 like protein n=1 Tax=Argiope bruennichi TaxID=94029 RepID=A0A8T0EPH5_ARGBR|nr:Matrilin-2 like protein [Argiope bruennichi]